MISMGIVPDVYIAPKVPSQPLNEGHQPQK